MKEEIREGIMKAIKREKASYTLYSAMCKKAKNPNTHALFQELAVQEMKHEALLNEFLRTGDILDAKEKVRAMYIDENIKLDDKINPTVTTMGIREGIEFAIKKEKNAQEYYKKLRGATSSSSAKDLFTELQDEEERHERLLRKEYEKLYG